MAEPTRGPIQVLYCGVCGLPAEYCEFGSNFERCKPWLKEHCPGLYPQLFEDKEEGEGEGEEGSEKKSSKRGGKGLNKPDNSDAEVQLLPGGKVKKKEKPIVHISKAQRRQRKWITTVSGLDKFGIKLSDASKTFAKTFSCGASVVKGTTGEEIDIQGDVMDDLVDLLTEKFNISEDSVVIDEKTKKK